MKRFWAIPVLAIFLVTASCNNARVVSSWKASGDAAAGINKILVLGIFPAKDSLLRSQMEEHLASDLISQGYDAQAACNLYGPCSFSGISEMKAIDSLAGQKFHAILTIVLLGSQTESYFIPSKPAPQQGPVSPFDHDLGRYYQYLNQSYTPGQLVTSTRYRWESNLFRASARQLIFNVRTNTFSSTNTNRDAHEYGLAIIKELRKKKLL